MKALGVRLIAGRNINPGEVDIVRAQQRPAPPQVIVTKAIVDKLFPNGDGLGKTIYLSKGKPSTIIGIVDKLTVPWIDFDHMDNVTIMPLIFNSGYQHFRDSYASGRAGCRLRGHGEDLVRGQPACVSCRKRRVCGRSTWSAAAPTRPTAAWRS